MSNNKSLYNKNRRLDRNCFYDGMTGNSFLIDINSKLSNYKDFFPNINFHIYILSLFNILLELISDSVYYMVSCRGNKYLLQKINSESRLLYIFISKHYQIFSIVVCSRIFKINF